MRGGSEKQNSELVNSKEFKGISPPPPAIKKIKQKVERTQNGGRPADNNQRWRTSGVQNIVIFPTRDF